MTTSTTPPSRWRNPTLMASEVAVLGIVVAILAYSTASKGAYWETAALLALYAAAASVAGGFLGFLFGIPRSVVVASSEKDSKDAKVAGVVMGSLGQRPTSPNTNLEQISDWLTKIIVGATLVELGSIPPALGGLFTSLGAPIGTASATVFTGALMIFAAVCGFVGGWLCARLWLPGLIARADKEEPLTVTSDSATAGRVEAAALVDGTPSVADIIAWFERVSAEAGPARSGSSGALR